MSTKALRIMGITLILLGIANLFIPRAAHSDELVPIPHLSGGYVVDQAGVLSASDIQAMNKKLAVLDKTKTNVTMGILVLPSTKGEPIEQFSTRVAEAWKLGHAGRDDGVVLVVATADRKVRLEVDRGISGDLPDIAARGILSKVNPDFKKGNFSVGILTIINDVGDTIKAPVSAVAVAPPVVESNYSWLWFVGFLLLIGGTGGYFWWRDKKEEERQMAEWEERIARNRQEMEDQAKRIRESLANLKTSMLQGGGPAAIPFPYKIEPSKVAGVAAGASLVDALSQGEKDMAEREALRRAAARRQQEEDEEEERKRRSSNVTDDLISAGIGLVAGLALGGGSDDSSSRSDDSPSYSPSDDSSSTSSDGGGSSDSF